jgi:hypothetical protein
VDPRAVIALVRHVWTAQVFGSMAMPLVPISTRRRSRSATSCRLDTALRHHPDRPAVGEVGSGGQSDVGPPARARFTAPGNAALLGPKSAVESWDTYGHPMGDEDVSEGAAK